MQSKRRRTMHHQQKKLPRLLPRARSCASRAPRSTRVEMITIGRVGERSKSRSRRHSASCVRWSSKSLTRTSAPATTRLLYCPLLLSPHPTSTPYPTQPPCRWHAPLRARGRAFTCRLPAGVKSGAEFYFCIEGERVSTAQETRKRPWECGDGGIELRAKRSRPAAPAVAIPTADAPAAIVLTTAVTPTATAPGVPPLYLPRAPPVPPKEPPTLASAMYTSPAQAVAAELPTLVGGVAFASEAHILSATHQAPMVHHVATAAAPAATAIDAPAPAAATLRPTAATLTAAAMTSVALGTLPPYTLTLVGKAAYVRSQLGLGEGMTLPQQDSDPSMYPSISSPHNGHPPT